ALDRAHAVGPVVALTHAEVVLDALVVRLDVALAERLAVLAEQAGGLVPLREVDAVGAHRDLGVDRRRAADAAPADHDDGAGTPVGGRHREADRPPEVVARVRLLAAEV